MGITLIDKSGRRGRKVEPLAPEPRGDLAPTAVLSAVGFEERQRLRFSQDPDGPESEHITGTSLQILGRYGWTVVDATGRAGFPELESVHLAVGPGGVVLVDEKLWTGHVVIEDGVLRHNGYRCEDAVAALVEACGSIQALVSPEYRGAVAGVLYVTPRDMAPDTTAGVYVVGRLHLASLLVDLPQRLTPMDVADISRELNRQLAAPVTPLAASGGAALSGGTIFYPTTSTGQETAAYFVPRQALPPEQPVEVPRSSQFVANRFGIRGEFRPVVAPPEQRRRRRRGDVARLTVALLAALVTFQQNEQIAVAVTDWIEPTVTAPATPGAGLSD